jgi:hypothetical protein
MLLLSPLRYFSFARGFTSRVLMRNAVILVFESDTLNPNKAFSTLALQLLR